MLLRVPICADLWIIVSFFQVPFKRLDAGCNLIVTFLCHVLC